MELTKENAKHLGRLIVAEREALGINQYQLAKIADVSTQTLAHIEKGGVPRIDTALKIKEALDDMKAKKF